MKYFLIAGEASGDLHAAHLMSALRVEDPQADFAYMGGAAMRERGGTCVLRSEEMAYMGIVDVLRHYPEIRRGRNVVRQSLIDYRPDVVICVDYGSFCMRYILPFVRKQLPTTRIVYFIPPKVWAWKEFRVRQLRRDCDLIQCVFPFEVPYFCSRGVERVSYVGNPTYEEVMHFRSHRSADVTIEERPYIALLCGSRLSEVRRNLPLMLESVASLGDRYRLVVAGVSAIDRSLYSEIIERHSIQRVEVRYGETYEILSGADAALVTSGTATLETALLGAPQVVCYATRAGRLVNFAFDHFFKVPYISLVNLIARREVVAELFGGKCTVEAIRSHLTPLLSDSAERRAMLEAYDAVSEALRTEFPASTLAAREIVALL